MSFTFEESITYKTILDLLIFSNVFLIPIVSISSSVDLIPAVSINLKLIPFITTSSSIESLVVPAISLTIDRESSRGKKVEW